MAVRDWSPTRYGAFRDLRLRPALDLLAQVPDVPAGEVIDLGSGAGAVGPALAARFGRGHRLIGVDTSEAMLAEAGLLRDAAGKGLYDRLIRADITLWQPEKPPALIFSNAALNWVPDHPRLLPRLADMLAPGGVLAVQMPRQGDAPSHRLLGQVAEMLFPGRFPVATSPVLTAEVYAKLLAEQGEVTCWTTEYLQRMAPVAEGHPVRAFTQSTAMRPFLAVLSEAEAADYVRAYDQALDTAYPTLASGEVLFPFTRVFLVLERV